MQVEVRLFATLRNGRFKKEVKQYPDDMTVETVMSSLKVNFEDIAIILINGHDGKLSSLLKDGDVLSVFPPVGGG